MHPKYYQSFLLGAYSPFLPEVFSLEVVHESSYKGGLWCQKNKIKFSGLYISCSVKQMLGSRIHYCTVDDDVNFKNNYEYTLRTNFCRFRGICL